MKLCCSQHKLKDIYDFEELKRLFNHFTILTGIDVFLYNTAGEEERECREYREENICETLNNRRCNNTIKYAAEIAAALGEPYIYNCCCMVRCTVPLIFKEQLIGSISCGPVLLWELDDMAQEEVGKLLQERGIEVDKIKDLLARVKKIECDYLNSAAQMLYLLANYIAKEESGYLLKNKAISQQQRQIAERLIDEKQEKAATKLKAEGSTYKKISMDIEKKLIAHLQIGDTKNGKRMLNELLGEIFSISSGNLNVIKAKLYELTAILMRSAVDAGAPLESISQHINHYNKILAKDTTFEELCYLTSEILEEFMAIVYEHRPGKQISDHLIKAINFIEDNYKHDLTLRKVAKEVYINNYYLSHLFKKELNTTFTDYLKKVRMEQCVKLMKKKQLKIREIAEAVGFKDANYFSRTFKDYYGVNPRKYRRIYG